MRTLAPLPSTTLSQITVAKPTKRRPFSAHPGHSSLSTLEKSCGTLVPKRDSSGNSNLTNGVNCSRNTVFKSNESATNRCCICSSWFGWVWVQRYHPIQGCGTGCPTSTERVVIMRTLQAGLDLTDDADKVIFRQFGGESSLRTLQSGHTVIRADQLDRDGWQLPGITELRQKHDEGCATNHMSVIAHVYQRPQMHGQRCISRRP